MNRGVDKEAKKLALQLIAEKRKKDQPLFIERKMQSTVISFTDSEDEGSEYIAPAGIYPAAEGNEDDLLLDQMNKLSIEQQTSAQREEPTSIDIDPIIIEDNDDIFLKEEDCEEQHQVDIEQDDDPACLVLGSSREFKLSAKLSTMLYPHQVEGVKWLFGLYKVSSGGILADDMGLGKTMQISALLSGLLKNKLIKRALVVAPKTLLAAWTKELAVCGLKDQTFEYGGSQTERASTLSRIVSNGGVLVTTYGMILHNCECLSTHPDHDEDGDGPLWSLMVMDEGHKLKNPKTKLRTLVEVIPVTSRILITGTPISNNLMEMHALFDLVCPGLLGSSKAFKDEFEKRITEGSDKDATVGERQRAAAVAAALRKKIAPFMLRREKKEVFGAKQPPNSENSGNNGPQLSQTNSNRESSVNLDSENRTIGGSVHKTVGDLKHDPGQCMHQQPLSAQQTVESSVLKKESKNNMNSVPNMTVSEKSTTETLPRKNDFVVWLSLEQSQRRLYEAFLHSDSVRSVLNQTSSALASLTVLKKICDHPALLSDKAQEGIASGAERAARKALGEGSDNEDGDSDSEGDDVLRIGKEKKAPKPPNQHHTQPLRGPLGSNVPTLENQNKKDIWPGTAIDKTILMEMHTSGLEASCKTAFVLSLLRHLVTNNHRTLVFSQSRVMLDILEAGIRAEGWKLCRIDGSIASASERQARVELFQTDSSFPIFLLTSQVGGLGLTLTAADRVIIVDPAWNPTVDSQSVDRAYRIGQKRDVVVYRLISCGTVEDKIYRKQVFKGGLSRTGMEEGEQFRYFSAADLRDLFTLNPQEALRSSTQRQLDALHAHQRVTTPELEQHLQFLKTLKGFAGVSDHDLLYSVKEASSMRHGNRGDLLFGAQPYDNNNNGSSQRQRGQKSPTRKDRKTFSSNNNNPRQYNSHNNSHRVGGERAGRSSSQGGNNNNNYNNNWSGADDVAEMFARALDIRCDDPASNQEHKIRRPYQPSGHIDDPPRDPLLSVAELKIANIRHQIDKQQRLLADSSIVRGLPDGGARIRANVEQLKSELNVLTGPLGAGAHMQGSVFDKPDQLQQQQQHQQQQQQDGRETLRPPPQIRVGNLAKDSTSVSLLSPLGAGAMKSMMSEQAQNASTFAPPPPPPPRHPFPSVQQQQQQQQTWAQPPRGQPPQKQPEQQTPLSPMLLSPLGAGAKDSMMQSRQYGADLVPSAAMRLPPPPPPKIALSATDKEGEKEQQRSHIQQQKQTAQIMPPKSPMQKFKAGIAGLFSGKSSAIDKASVPLEINRTHSNELEKEKEKEIRAFSNDKNNAADANSIDSLSFFVDEDDDDDNDDATTMPPSSTALTTLDITRDDDNDDEHQRQKPLLLRQSTNTRRELKRQLHERAQVLAAAEDDPHVDSDYVVQIREEVQSLADTYYTLLDNEKDADEL